MNLLCLGEGRIEDDYHGILKNVNHLYMPLSNYKRLEWTGKITGLEIGDSEDEDFKIQDLETILPLSLDNIPLYCVDTILLLPTQDLFTITLFLQAVRLGDKKQFIIYRPKESWFKGLLQLLNEQGFFDTRNINVYTSLNNLFRVDT